MPAKTNESPPRQQDEAPITQDPQRATLDELRNFAPGPPREDADYDIGEWMDYPSINTNGSER